MAPQRSINGVLCYFRLTVARHESYLACTTQRAQEPTYVYLGLGLFVQCRFDRKINGLFERNRPRLLSPCIPAD